MPTIPSLTLLATLSSSARLRVYLNLRKQLHGSASIDLHSKTSDQPRVLLPALRVQPSRPQLPHNCRQTSVCRFYGKYFSERTHHHARSA